MDERVRQRHLKGIATPMIEYFYMECKEEKKNGWKIEDNKQDKPEI